MANYVEPKSSMTGSTFSGVDMGQNPLNDQSHNGFEQYSQTFGKYLSEKEGKRSFSEEERLKRERARKANKIYRQVCEDFRLNACFFSNFGDWSEYVDGKMSDAEFHSHARTRAEQMMSGQN